MEIYVGTKFRTVFARPDPPRNDELSEWCRRWAAAGFIGKAMGNLSARHETGFLITPTGSDPAKLAPEDKYAGLAPRDRLAKTWPELDLIDSNEPSSERLVEFAKACEAAALGVPGITTSPSSAWRNPASW